MGYQQDKVLREISVQGKIISDRADEIRETSNKITIAKQNLAELEAIMTQAQIEFHLALQRDTALRAKLTGMD